jgi:hypothetical protein
MKNVIMFCMLFVFLVGSACLGGVNNQNQQFNDNNQNQQFNDAGKPINLPSIISTAKAEPGARLHTITIKGADGSKLLTERFHDATLGVDCTFYTQQGSTKPYCIPAMSNLIPVYTDKSCSHKVYIVNGCQENKGYGYELIDTGVCGYSQKLYKIKVGAVIGAVFSKSGAECVNMSKAWGGYKIATTQEIGIDTFVAGEETVQ